MTALANHIKFVYYTHNKPNWLHIVVDSLVVVGTVALISAIVISV